MPEDDLSHDEALILALFQYGLASNPEEAATHLHRRAGDILRVCQRLAALGLLFFVGDSLL